jgi:hypothetical protein
LKNIAVYVCIVFLFRGMLYSLCGEMNTDSLFNFLKLMQHWL